MSDQPSGATSSSSLTCLIDSRSGSVEVHLAPGETWVGVLNLSPGDRTALSQPQLTATLEKLPFETAPGN
jgi:hypothetical protein